MRQRLVALRRLVSADATRPLRDVLVIAELQLWWNALLLLISDVDLLLGYSGGRV